MQARVVFMGTPDFAVPALEMLGDRFGREDLLVVTQPDRAAGRGRRLQSPPVKVAAQRLNLPVEQVSTLRDAGIRERLEPFAPDLIVVAAFGLLLPKWVLTLPPRGCVNLHASLLPRFRGASPVAAAIACGDATTGVALMEMEAGLDTGGVYARAVIDITYVDTTASLTAGLAREAATLLSAQLDALIAGEMTLQAQQGRIVETRKIAKAHGAIDWGKPAVELERHVRAMWPWPRAWTVGAGDARVQVHQTEVVADVHGEAATVTSSDAEGVVIATGDGGLRLLQVQLPGKKPQPAGDLRQHPVFATGSRFHSPGGQVDPWIVVDGEAGN